MASNNISIPLHTHECALRFIAGLGGHAVGPFLFHRLILQPVIPRFTVPREPATPEVWKSFTNGYEVSNRGHVRSRWQLLVNLLDSRGEPFQKIRGKWYRVKRLVAEAFLPNPSGKKRVRHINDNLHDCRVENLEWW